MDVEKQDDDTRSDSKPLKASAAGSCFDVPYYERKTIDLIM